MKQYQHPALKGQNKILLRKKSKGNFFFLSWRVQHLEKQKNRIFVFCFCLEYFNGTSQLDVFVSQPSMFGLGKTFKLSKYCSCFLWSPFFSFLFVLWINRRLGMLRLFALLSWAAYCIAFSTFGPCPPNISVCYAVSMSAFKLAVSQLKEDTLKTLLPTKIRSVLFLALLLK